MSDNELIYSTLKAHGIDNPYWDILMNEVPSDNGPGARAVHGEIIRYIPTSYGRQIFRNGEAIEDGSEKKRFPDRSELTRRFSWAIPSPDSVRWMAHILGDRPLVEMGAGTGYWAWQLSQAGVDVEAFDLYPPDTSANWFHSNIETVDSVISEEDVEEWNKRYGALYDGLSKLMPQEGSWLPPKLEAPRVGDPTRRVQVVPNTTRKVWFKVEKGGPEVLAEYGGHALFLCWPPYETSLAYDSLKAYPGDHLFFCGEGKDGCTGNDAFFELLEKEWVLSEWCQEFTAWSGMHDGLHYYTRKA